MKERSGRIVQASRASVFPSSLDAYGRRMALRVFSLRRSTAEHEKQMPEAKIKIYIYKKKILGVRIRK